MKKSLAIASVFIWIGFVCAISFMEAWLKFRAPGVSLPIGLGIGRLVFFALNKVEWVLLIITLLSLRSVRTIRPDGKTAIILLLGILCLQTFWILPVLDLRAEMHISGAVVPPSAMHLYYVAVEIVKMASLVVLGRYLLINR